MISNIPNAGVPGKRHPGRRHVHRACQAQNGHRHGRGLRAEAPGSYSVRFRRLKAASQPAPFV